MRYITKEHCKSAFEKGIDKEITRMGKLTRTACRIAENNKLGLTKTRMGHYRIIKECGLTAYDEFLYSLEEVDYFFKHLDEFKNSKY